MAYVITYDLHAPGQNYEQLEEAIKTLGPALHIASSTWILIHPWPEEFIRNYLLNFIGKNDTIIVIECSSNIAWHGIKPVQKAWLRMNL